MSRLRCRELAVTDHRRPVLEPTTLELESGELHVAYGDPGHGHTVLALALAGRFSGHQGTVHLDDSAERATLQGAVALVDVPGVSEPDPNVPFATVVGEELAMARRRAGRAAVREWLAAEHLEDLVGQRVEEVPPSARVAALAQLAALRPGVRFLVAVLPERLGDTPRAWLPPLQALADDGLGVLVTTSLGVAEQLGIPDSRPGTALGNAVSPDSAQDTTQD